MMDNFKLREEKLQQLRTYHKSSDFSAIVRLASDDDPIVRAEALILLGKIDGKAFLKVLIDGLQDEDQHVRYCAADALGNVNSEEVVEPLVFAARDNSDFVCCKAINSLGKIHSSRAINFLVSQLVSPNEIVSQEAAASLESMLDIKECRTILLEVFDDDLALQEKFNQLHKMLKLTLRDPFS